MSLTRVSSTQSFIYIAPIDEGCREYVHCIVHGMINKFFSNSNTSYDEKRSVQLECNTCVKKSLNDVGIEANDSENESESE